MKKNVTNLTLFCMVQQHTFCLQAFEMPGKIQLRNFTIEYSATFWPNPIYNSAEGMNKPKPNIPSYNLKETQSDILDGEDVQM